MKKHKLEPHANAQYGRGKQGHFHGKQKHERRPRLQSILELAMSELDDKPVGQVTSRDVVKYTSMKAGGAEMDKREFQNQQAGAKGRLNDYAGDPTKRGGKTIESKYKDAPLFTRERGKVGHERGHGIDVFFITDAGRRKLRELRLKHG